MTTELINLNDYRKNISTLWKKAREQNIKYVVLSHSKAIFEVNPIFSNEMKDDWDVQYTNKNHEAWLKAKKELIDDEVINVDFSKINNADDFISLIKS